MRKSLILMTLPIAACSTTPPAGPIPAPPQVEAALAPEVTPAAANALAYPQTRREDVVENQFGVAVADPYRWLENDVRKDPAVAAWVTEQNKVTDAFLDTLPGRDILKKRMTELYNYERVGTPVKKGRRYFYQRNTGLQNQSPLFVRDSLNGPERLLIDPNTFSQDGATALAEWVPSEDGRYLLYAIQDGGSDWRKLKVLDVATGKTVGDEIKWVKFSALSWSKDNKGFFYSRFPESKEGQDFQSLNKNQAVYYHRLGTAQSADRLMFDRPDRPELSNIATVSDDGSTLVVTSSSGTDERYEVTLVDWQKAKPTRRVLIPGFTHDYSYIGNRGSTYYFETNDGAPRLKVVAIDVAAARPNKRTVIAEQPETLSGTSLVGGKIIASYLKDAATEVRVHSLAGVRERVIELPGLGTAGGFSGDLDDPETFFSFASFNRPTTIYRYDVKANATQAWFEPKLLFNPDDFTVEQRFFASKDGTRVPMFIVRKKGLTGPAPTLLYAYGGFNISLTCSPLPFRRSA
jgi:prolyl oligopeptidase